MALRHVLLLVVALALLGAFLPLAQAAQEENLGRIAFSSDRDDPNYDIYAVDPDGSNVTRLTADDGFDGYPAWSPDGQTIAFVSQRDGGDSDIFLMNPDGTNVRQLTFNDTRDSEPAWSVDGQRIAFVGSRDGNREIFVMRADGSRQTQVTETPAPELNDNPAFVDGDKIVFEHAPDGDTFLGPFSIRTVHRDGTHLEELSPGVDQPGQPAVSYREGHRIVFVDNICFGCPNSDVFTMKADGNKVQEVTDGFGNNLYPDWSPHGGAIVFTHEDEGHVTFIHEEIYTVDEDGSNLFNVTHNGLDGPDDWGASWGCPDKGDCKK
jgi:TolB protein